jgi:hypothetical protein
MRMGSTKEREQRFVQNSTESYALRDGYVIGKVFPGDAVVDLASNLPPPPPRTAIAYKVLLTQSVHDFGTMPVVAICDLAVPFGSTADSFHATVRCPINLEIDDYTPELLAETSRVLVLCRNGRTDLGVIIGMLQNEKGPPENREDGSHLDSSFNGITTSINKDGEYTLTFTDQPVDLETNKVKDPDPDKAGSFFKINKDGSVILNDNAGASITIDKPNHNINVTASGETRIGSASSDEHLVLGATLRAALADLLSYLGSFAGNPAIPGVPVGVNVIAQIQTWATQYTLDDGSPLLAQDKFTERNTS